MQRDYVTLGMHTEWKVLWMCIRRMVVEVAKLFAVVPSIFSLIMVIFVVFPPLPSYISSHVLSR